jgi:threonyl-tRNA synthetase
MSENDKVTLTLPDGKTLSLPRGSTVNDAAGAIGKGLQKAAVAGRLDGRTVDLGRKIERDARLEILTEKSEEALEVLRHSASHLMAQAVLRHVPKAKLAIGPPIEDGFYYDIDVEKTLTDEDLEEIERTMHEIVEEDLPICRSEGARAEAIEKMRASGDVYKAELLQEMEDDSVSFYSQGEFQDLCRGPHLPSTGRIKAFKLLHTAGAYWRGDSSRKMLQRIYGTAFFNQKDLEEHLKRLEEAKKRDHRKIGKALDLFSFHPEAPATPFFHPKGALLYNKLVEHIRGLYREYGYQEVITPQILTVDLWHRSGHYDNYQENMFFTRFDDREYAVKPMNCPTHALIYGTRLRSYKDLPLRYADFGRLHRYELSGATAGLTRVRSFAQDDAHIFCMKEQIESEVNALIDMFLKTYRLFGFDDFRIYLSTKPEKYIGSDDVWAYAEDALRAVLEKSGHPFQIDPGEGVFYGPKIDFKVFDAMKRRWQLGTIHRAMLGSIERFLGVYLEHTAGDLPLWLNPVQVRILALNDESVTYCDSIKDKLQARDFRVETDYRNETMGYKIREATLEKVSYMIIIGDREIQNSRVSVRERKDGDLGSMGLEEFIALLQKRMSDKS